MKNLFKNKLFIQFCRLVATIAFVVICYGIMLLIDINQWYILVADAFTTFTIVMIVSVTAKEKERLWFMSMILSCIGTIFYSVLINAWILLFLFPMLFVTFIIILYLGIKEYEIEEDKRRGYYSY